MLGRLMKTYHEIVGDGGSNVLEQVVAQRAKVRDNLSQVKWIVAVPRTRVSTAEGMSNASA